MDPELIAELKQRNLLPLELDGETLIKIVVYGADSKTETHYSPGTQRWIIKKHYRIVNLVRELYRMEKDDRTEPEDYVRTYRALRTALYELDHPTAIGVLEKNLARLNVARNVFGQDECEQTAAFRHEQPLEFRIFYRPIRHSDFFLRDDRPVVHFLIDENNADSGLTFVVQYR